MDKGTRKIQYLVTFSVSLVFIALGTTSAWPSPVISKFNRNETDVEINDEGVSWMVSLNAVGFVVGSFVTRFISDKFGRRATILSSAVPLAMGSIIIACALKAWLLCVAVFSWCCATGMMSSIMGIYLAEISDKAIRATLALYTRVAFNFGQLLVMSIGPSLTYSTLNYSLLPLPFISLISCLWIPETPYFLLKEGRVDEARKVLRKLRGYRDEMLLEDEITTIQQGVKHEMTKSSTVKELFTGKQYRRSIIVATGLKLTQILSGGVIIRQYLGVIMQESHLNKEHEQIVFIVYGAISFVVCVISSILVDKIGRRPLLIGSYIGTGLSLTIVGIYLYLLKFIEHDILYSYVTIPFIGIVMSNVISTFGFQALSSVIPCEIFPINVKVVAITALSVFGGILGFILGVDDRTL